MIEPVATVPLAIMSVINSSVFCGTLETARIVTYRFFTEREFSIGLDLIDLIENLFTKWGSLIFDFDILVSEHWVIPYFLIMTHIGVAVQYWGRKKTFS